LPALQQRGAFNRCQRRVAVGVWVALDPAADAVQIKENPLAAGALAVGRVVTSASSLGSAICLVSYREQ